MTDLLAIIPARAGSRRVPGKNKILIGGIPVIEYTIAAVEAARPVTGVVLSTDDEDIIARYGRRSSIFLVERPASLARDESSSADVVAHAVDAWRASGKQVPTSLLLAQPTTPLRTAADVEAAFDLFLRSGSQPLVSCCRAEGIRHPDVMYRLCDNSAIQPLSTVGDGAKGGIGPTDKIYQRNGAIYIVSTEFFLRTGRLRNSAPVIYEMPWERSINIDIPGDFLIAKALIESKLLKSDGVR